MEYSIWSLWKLADKPKPNNNLFPSDFWQNCLAVIPEEDSDNNANIYYTAHLIWGPKPNFNAAGYKVYRSINNSNNYELIYTISSQIYLNILMIHQYIIQQTHRNIFIK